MLTRRHLLAGAAATAAVAAMPAAHAIAAVEQAPESIDTWAFANIKMMSPADVGACFQPYLRSVLDAMTTPNDDDIVITKAVDVACGTVPEKIDGLAYIRDVAAGRRR
ncbi:MAG: hypothetical protein Q7T73_16870 [Beijerinckiaceae bacterium]|nr:hypothetical protein [Beijerinckiaceae bacterium]